MSCPSWKTIEETQVYKVISTGDTAYQVMTKLLRDFGDCWKEGEMLKLGLAMRRLNRKHLISYNREGRAWVKT